MRLRVASDLRSGRPRRKLAGALGIGWFSGDRLAI